MPNKDAVYSTIAHRQVTPYYHHYHQLPPVLCVKGTEYPVRYVLTIKRRATQQVPMRRTLNGGVSSTVKNEPDMASLDMEYLAT